jgi:hypothetical protein
VKNKIQIACFETVFFGGVIFHPLLAAVAQAVPTIWSTSGENGRVNEHW